MRACDTPRQRVRTAIAAGLSLALMAGLSQCASGSKPWPTQSWPTATPESAGLDSGKLADGLGEIRRTMPNTHAVFLVMDGRVVLDAAFYPYDGNAPHNVASVTKSVMTTLVAIAADQGKLALDKPFLTYFADRRIANRDARKERITVRHLAGMTAGLDCVGEHDEPTLHRMLESPDWVQFALDLKTVAEPGTVFSYCSPGTHLLSAVLQRATGMTALDFARKNLFEPLGIRDVVWWADPQGVTRGWADLQLRPQDAAKLGYLWLNHGVWEGRQLVSREWVDASSRAQIRTTWGGDYGYGWWVHGDDAIPYYAAVGRGGQRVAVYPSLAAIAVVNGGGLADGGKVLEPIAGALTSPGKPLAENPAGIERLRQAIKDAATAPTPTAAKPQPAIAATVSGEVFRFDANPLKLATLRLDFDKPDQASFDVTFSDGQPQLHGVIGLDGVYRTAPGDHGMLTGARGAWTSERTFFFETGATAGHDAHELTLRFEDDRVVVTVKERSYESGVALVATAER